MKALPAKRNIWSIVRRLVCGVAVYYKWQERNNRLFKNEKRESKTVLNIAKEAVGMKLMGLKVKESKTVKEVEERMPSQAKLLVMNFNTHPVLNPSIDAWLSTSQAVRRALEDYGCFVVSLSKLDTIFELSKDLFHLPLETKIKNTSDMLVFGYGNFSSYPFWEYFSIENGDTLEATQRFTDLMFPSGNNAFCENALKYMKMLSEIDQCVMRMVYDSYGVDTKQCDQSIASMFYLARFIKYRPPSEDKRAMAIDHPMTEKSFISILGDNNVKGLEIQMRNGMEQREDLRSCASSGNENTRGRRTRYTLGLFSFTRETVKVPKELVEDDENYLRFKPFNHLDFLKYVITEELQGHKCSIRSYCGVTTTAPAKAEY
ncbi:probable 2-oxoglutarate-dependent dioxygenase AOP1 [Tanacetum coccineum]